jgi:hypothetical protein
MCRNSSLSAYGTKPGLKLGPREFSVEHRKKLSMKNTGQKRPPSAETIEKRRIANTGKKRGPYKPQNNLQP